MKHRTEIIITTIITILICFVAVPVGVNYAFRYEAPVDILAARWKASDALNYIATVLAFIGTFFLGLVAWKQNTDLKKSRQICLLQTTFVKSFWKVLS